MGRIKRLNETEIREARRTLALEAEKGIPIGLAIKSMRRSLNLDQKDFARLVKVAPRVLMETERGRGNPTKETLEKIGRPFGFVVGYIPSERDGDRRP